MRKFALVVMLLGIQPLLRAQTAQNSWAALNALHSGQRVEIVETNLKRHNGTFSTLTDEGLQLREGDGDVGIKREDVMRVTLLDKNQRLRNALIFGAVGAGAGAGIGVIGHHQGSLQNPNGTFIKPAQGAEIGALLGSLGGAAIGAAVPSHPTIYRIEHN